MGWFYYSVKKKYKITYAKYTHPILKRLSIERVFIYIAIFVMFYIFLVAYFLKIHFKKSTSKFFFDGFKNVSSGIVIFHE